MVKPSMPEALSGLVLVALGGLVFVMSLDLTWITPGDAFGPGFVPGVTSAVLVLAGLRVAAQARRGSAEDMAADRAGAEPLPTTDEDTPEQADAQASTPTELQSTAGRRVIVAGIALVAAALLMPVLGMLLTLGALVFVVSRLVYALSWRTSALFTACVVAGTWLIFDEWLNVPLPGIGG